MQKLTLFWINIPRHHDTIYYFTIIKLHAYDLLLHILKRDTLFTKILKVKDKSTICKTPAFNIFVPEKKDTHPINDICLM